MRPRTCLTPTLSPLQNQPSFFFLFLTQLAPTRILFPYTTLFRSLRMLIDESRVSFEPTVVPEFVIGGNGPHVFALRQPRSEEHTSELQSQFHLVCRLLLEKKKQ